MGRRERKREETRNEIVVAARLLFRERGYDATSIDDIVACADMAKGTFYYHFDSKDDVVAAMRFEAIEEIILVAEAALEAGQSAKTIVEGILLSSAKWSEDNPTLAHVFYSRAPIFMQKMIDWKGHAPPGHHYPPLPMVLEKIIARGQSEGTFRSDMAAVVISDLIVFMLFHAQLRWVLEGEKDSITKRVKDWYRALCEGITGS